MINVERQGTSPVQHIRNLMNSIKDEKLTITYHDPLEPSKPPYTETYDVSCTVADADEFVSKYEALTSALEVIGKLHEKLDSGVKVEDVLTPEQITVWNTYVRDFDEVFDAGEYNLDEIYDMRACGAELNDDEHEVLERHYEWLEEQCLKRLPKNVCSPMHLINRAQRYECFVKLNAPQIILDEEGGCLAVEMILYYRSK